jgi:hypothetical protein
MRSTFCKGPFVAMLLVVGVLLTASPGQSQEFLTEIPRTPEGTPDLTGVWQALNNAHWNIEPHSADYPVLAELGAQFAIPPSQGVVEGGEIPYLPEALAQRDENFANRLGNDPEAKCYRGGIPRSTYMPYPFQIFQNTDNVIMVYQFATALRNIFVGGTREAPIDSWLGWSNGNWEGDTFVVDVTGVNGLTWMDRAGNFTSLNARIQERFTLMGPNHIQYEATITDPTIYSRPWTIGMPLYRRVESDFQFLEFKCVAFSEEILYGHLRKPPED